MRLTILFLMVVGVTATNASTTDVSGVWVAVIDRCDFGPASHPMRLVLNVTRDENRLKVIEVFNGEDGAVLAERQFRTDRYPPNSAFFDGSPTSPDLPAIRRDFEHEPFSQVSGPASSQEYVPVCLISQCCTNVNAESAGPSRQEKLSRTRRWTASAGEPSSCIMDSSTGRRRRTLERESRP